MTIGDGPRTGGTGERTGADQASVPAPDDVPGDDSMFDDEVVDAEVIDETSVGDDVVDEAFESDPLDVALAERDEYLDSLRRLQAEFENYKKRVFKQQAEQVSRAAASLVDKLLPVLDALDLATDHVGDADSAEAKALVAKSRAS